MVAEGVLNEYGAMKFEDATNFDTLDKQVICDLIDAGVIDGDLLIRVVQVMMLPEFKDFFVALCKIDLTEVDQSAAILREVAQKLVRPDESSYSPPVPA